MSGEQGNRTSGMEFLRGSRSFTELTVDDALVVEKANLVCVKDTDLLFDVLKIISQHRILGALVLSAPPSDPKAMFLGFVDSLDVVRWIISSNAAFVAAKKAEMGDIASVNVPCKELLATQTGKPLYVRLSAPIKDAIRTLVENRIQRFAVLTDSYAGDTSGPVPYSALHSIVTQSDFFSLMVSHTYSFSDSKSYEMSISALDFDLPKVYCCSLKDQTSDAFSRMYVYGYSSLGVTDEKGKLVNYLGVSHLKGLDKASLWDLYLPVDEFLKNRQPSFETFTLSAKLREVISAVKDAKYHRVFFVNQNGHSIGVMTLRDFLEVLVLKLRLFD